MSEALKTIQAMGYECDVVAAAQLTSDAAQQVAKHGHTYRAPGDVYRVLTDLSRVPVHLEPSVDRALTELEQWHDAGNVFHDRGGVVATAVAEARARGDRARELLNVLRVELDAAAAATIDLAGTP